MEIRGEIKKIVYSAQLSDLSKVIEFATFDVNKMPSSCILHIENSSFAISKWVSPKRTRSYPYERVYNTLSFSKKITIIPIIKDEGAAGDRDFLQWDTISLMSLLDVYVIPAFYTSAQARGAKITNQCFDTKFIADKIYEIKNFHSSALHWNLNELKENFGNLLDKVIQNYQKIEIETGIKLHNSDGIKRFQQKIEGDVANFMQFSREKAKSAQQRELETIQPKENLSSATKSKITITNFLGGQYFFTVDEIVFENQKLSLIEAKHSKNGWLPSKSDIKDGLLKVILYVNLSNIFYDERVVDFDCILKLTSTKIVGKISSKSSDEEKKGFFLENNLRRQQQNFIENLWSEALKNGFEIRIQQIEL